MYAINIIIYYITFPIESTKMSNLMRLMQRQISLSQKGRDSLEIDVNQEVNRYLAEDCLALNLSCFAWWKTNGVRFPRLKELARNYLGVVGTQVPSERVFSLAGNIVTDTRVRLLDENVEILSFLHSNWNLKSEVEIIKINMFPSFLKSLITLISRSHYETAP